MPPLASLRKDNVIVLAYIDDLILVHKEFNGCLEAVQWCVTLLESLGFLIHPDKCQFVPCQTIEYLGFVIDSREIQICLSNNRKVKIMYLSRAMQGLKHPSIQQVSQVLGAITSSFPGVEFGPLHYRLLESDKIKALKCAKGNFDRSISISSVANEKIQWWIDNVFFAKNFITHGNPSITVTTVASSTGWGAVFSEKRESGI
eukprot:gene13075-14418_t